MRTLTRLGLGAALTTAVLTVASCSNNGTASTPDLAVTTPPADLAVSGPVDLSSYADLNGSPVVRVTGGFAQPFSAFYDAATTSWYVSNVAGDLSDFMHLKDGRGWITKISADYKTVDHNFYATGLNAPAGLRVVSGKLYVADVDTLVVVDVAARSAVRSSPIPASIYPVVMIDVAVDSAGAAYVPESVSGIIYKYGTPTVDGAKYTSLYAPAGVSFPTTVYIDGTKLVVGTITNPQTSAPGHLFTMNLADGKAVSQLGTLAADFQGIEKDGTDYLIGTQRAHTVNRVALANGAASLVQDTAAVGGTSAVDLGWDPTSRTLAVPDPGTNAVYFYKLP